MWCSPRPGFVPEPLRNKTDNGRAGALCKAALRPRFRKLFGLSQLPAAPRSADLTPAGQVWATKRGRLPRREPAGSQAGALPQRWLRFEGCRACSPNGTEKNGRLPSCDEVMLCKVHSLQLLVTHTRPKIHSLLNKMRIFSSTKREMDSTGVLGTIFFHLCTLRVEAGVQKSVQKPFPNTAEQNGTRAASPVCMQKSC